MTNIILPVNFSREVRAVLISFIKEMMQKNTSAHFTLLHAYDTRGYGSAIMHDISEKLEDNANKDLELEKAKILEEVPEASIATYVGRGLLSKVVNSYEKDHKVDFMVIALKGSNMLQSILASSKPSELAENANIPMLFLPDTDTLKLPTNIAFGTDVKAFQNTEDFQHLLRMLKILEAKLHFVYVDEEGESKKEDFQALYAKYLENVTYDYTEVQNKSAAKGLMSFVKTNGLDGIAMIERKGNFLERLFSVSILDEMLETAKLPVMVINELREAK